MFFHLQAATKVSYFIIEIFIIEIWIVFKTRLLENQLAMELSF